MVQFDRAVGLIELTYTESFNKEQKRRECDIVMAVNCSNTRGNLALITICDNTNFGNRLQNYAAQTYFEQLGYEVQTIPYDEQCHPPLTLRHFFFKLIHFILRPTSFEKNRAKRNNMLAIRRTYIQSFSDQYIKSGTKVSYRKLPKNYSDGYDYFVTGSDQVWHCWTNNHRELEFFLLTFANPAQRLTIAPSFGFDKFPEKFIPIYKRGLSGFEYLSVREERGAQLIKEITGKDAIVLLDPTMLIDQSEWLKILKMPSQYTDDNFFLIYMLDGFKGEVREFVEHLANQLGMIVIDILDKGSDYYIHTRPDEFLYWIHNAKFIVTDSFHATVFAILFNRPFIVTERSRLKGMGSRIDSLLDRFGLENRKFEILKTTLKNNAVEGWEELFVIDYSCVSQVIEAERKKAIGFYKACMRLSD